MRLAVLLALLFSSLLAAAQQLAPIPPLDSPVVDTTGTLDAATALVDERSHPSTTLFRRDVS